MKQLITAKLKLHPDATQFRALRTTQLAYRDALNAVSRYAFAHGKMSNQVRLREETYYETRATYQLPAQMATNVPRQVGATYKTLWTKVRQNTAARQAGLTKKRYKGLDKPPTYVSPTLTYNYQRDYSLKPDHQVSILTLSGRVIVPYTAYSQHGALLHRGAHIGAAKLWYDKPKKQFYLLVCLEVEVADPAPDTHTGVTGVDVGVRVRREVAWIIARYGKNHSRAWCFTTSTLPGHAARVIQRCEAPGTMNPQSKDWCLNREGRASLLASKRKGARVSGTVNICECSLTVVTTNKPKMLTGLSQKALWLA